MSDFTINVKCPGCTTKQPVLIGRREHSLNFVDETGSDLVVCVEPAIINCIGCECDFVVDLEISGETSTRKIEGGT